MLRSKIIVSLFITLLLSSVAPICAANSNPYFERFSQYSTWNEQLPDEPTPDFLAFVQSPTPLGTKLREKWLYQLAQHQKWLTLNQYYQPSKDVNLQCLAIKAIYRVANQKEAVLKARTIWLDGNTLPGACNNLFELLLAENKIPEALLDKRFNLALDKRNLTLAKYLLKKYRPARTHDERLLDSLYRDPKNVIRLPALPAYSSFYLYSLKRLVSIDLETALKFWQDALQKKIISKADSQAFLAQVALYKAIRNSPDAQNWFAKVHPSFRSALLNDWQIRLALKQQDWQTVETLIEQAANKNTACWQYWLARAYLKNKHPEKGKKVLEKLAKTRNYYGFLASIQLKKPFSFNQQRRTTDSSVLKPYQSILDTIRQLYEHKQQKKASQLLTDFSRELSTQEYSALIYWVSHNLHWYSKAVALSEKKTVVNQLVLRFPIAYPDIIQQVQTNQPVAAALIYAVIKQESGFREEVISRAKAHGLMQVLPKTAASIAKENKTPYSSPTQLFQAKTNITLGTSYLFHLAKRYQHNWLWVVAAYNAGPTQVSYWQKNHLFKESDLWIETLPWHETRNYLKNVLSFYVVYQHLLGQKQDLSIFNF